MDFYPTSTFNKVIFLDIDGVVNCYGNGHDKYGSLFDAHLRKNLEYLIEQTKADIVISSTWRLSGLSIMKDMWRDRKLPGRIIGITPRLTDKKNDFVDRGYEIDYFLNQVDVKRYCILDDDTDMLEYQMPYFVQTSENSDHEDCVDIGYGLTKICTEKAIQILNR